MRPLSIVGRSSLLMQNSSAWQCHFRGCYVNPLTKGVVHTKSRQPRIYLNGPLWTAKTGTGPALQRIPYMLFGTSWHHPDRF